MAHHTLKASHQKLVERLNRFPQGAPPADLLFQILSVLFTEEEAGLVALLPIRPFTAAHASKIWLKTEAATLGILDRLADRGMLLDMEHPDGTRTFVLTPTASGDVDFAMEETYRGLLAPLITRSIPDLQPAFDAFAADLKRYAEESAIRDDAATFSAN